MKKYYQLIKIMLKTSFAQNQLNISKKKWVNYAFLVLLLISLLPTAGLYFYVLDNLVGSLKAINQQVIVINLIVAINTILIFMTSLLFMPTVYFFSKDVELYLPLPIKSWQIISGKFLVTLMSEYLLMLISFVPGMMAYLKHFPSISLFLGFILIFLLLPIFPLAIASLIILLGTKFIPFMRNKNFMTIIVGTLSIVFGVGISFFFQTASVFNDPEQLMIAIQQGANSLSKTLFAFLPPVKYAALFVSENSYISLLISVLISAAMFLLFLWVSQQVYFSTVTMIKESSTSNKLINLQSQTKNSKDLAYLKKELAILLRTPAYLMNNVLGAFLFPVLLIFPLFFSNTTQNADMIEAIKQIQFSPIESVAIGIFGGIALGFFNGSSNMISATAVSRDKNQIESNLTIPYPYWRQLVIKALLGSLVSLLVILLFAIILSMVSWTFFAIAIISIIPAFIASFAINLVSIYLDANFPRLKWETEQQATKNNFNGVISMFGSWAILGLFVFIYYKVQPPILIFSIVLLAFCLLIIFFLMYLIKRQQSSLVQKVQ